MAMGNLLLHIKINHLDTKHNISHIWTASSHCIIFLKKDIFWAKTFLFLSLPNSLEYKVMNKFFFWLKTKQCFSLYYLRRQCIGSSHITWLASLLKVPLNILIYTCCFHIVLTNCCYCVSSLTLPCTSTLMAADLTPFHTFLSQGLPIHPQQEEVDICHVGQVKGQYPEENQRYSELKELYCHDLSFKNILTKPFLHHYS